MTARAELDYFDRMYTGGDDPWRIEQSWYEDRKRAVLLGCLPRSTFRNAFEPGCAGGRLTVELAPRCERLLAVDAHPRAVELTRSRVAAQPNVDVGRLVVPDEWPAGKTFDLVVLSEFGYFMEPPSWRELAERLAPSLAGDGTVVACHWRHPFAERRAESIDLHEVLHAALNPSRRTHLVDADFVLDVWSAT